MWTQSGVERNDHSLVSLYSSVNDTLDDLFEDSGDEEESQDIVNQVLDEIGIEITGKVSVPWFIGGWDKKKSKNSRLLLNNHVNINY